MNPPELAIVIPTFNERDNIDPMLDALETVLNGISWEVIFVDDCSTDGTSKFIWERGQRDPRVRCILRVGRRGLSTACIEGILATSAPYAAVIDADLQHDESLLPLMLDKLKKEKLDIVVGSRYIDTGSEGDWNFFRVVINRIATTISKIFLKTTLRDPMSGFFMLKRDHFLEIAQNLSGQGFKILLDIFSSASSPIKFKELPYKFRQRMRGESKIDTLVIWQFLQLILEKTVGRFLPLRFISFIFIGALGVLTHLCVLGLLYLHFIHSFLPVQSIATLFAMTQNFLLNNMLTYSDLRLRGVHFARGLLKFYFACGIGGVINIILAQFLYQLGAQWFIAGFFGAIIGAIWNYTTTKTIVWIEKL